MNYGVPVPPDGRIIWINCRCFKRSCLAGFPSGHSSKITGWAVLHWGGISSRYVARSIDFLCPLRAYCWARSSPESSQVSYSPRGFPLGLILVLLRHCYWKLVVQNNEGKLNAEEKGRLGECCKQLAEVAEDPFDRTGGTVDTYGVFVFVRSGQGAVVEKYKWDGRMERLEKLNEMDGVKNCTCSVEISGCFERCTYCTILAPPSA